MIPFICVMLLSLGAMMLGMTCAANLPVLFTSASILTNPTQTPPYDNYRLYLVYREADEIKVVRDKLVALAMQLQADPQYDAWILSYAGQRACSAEARHRAGTAKRYLVSKGISPGRIKTVDAGFHEQWGVELWMVIRNTPGPIPLAAKNPCDTPYASLGLSGGWFLMGGNVALLFNNGGVFFQAGGGTAIGPQVARNGMFKSPLWRIRKPGWSWSLKVS